MRQLLTRVLLLLPVALTIVPFPEMSLPMYYLAPSMTTAIVIFVLAVTISTLQMLYLYWAVGEVERLAPSWSSRTGAWLDRQTIVKAIRQKPSLILFLSGLCPGVRVGGITLWQTTKHPWGGFLLIAGTALQLAFIFGGMLGLGELIRSLFR